MTKKVPKRSKQIMDGGWGMPPDWTVSHMLPDYKRNSFRQRWIMQNVKTGELAIMVMGEDLVPTRIIWIDRI